MRGCPVSVWFAQWTGDRASQLYGSKGKRTQWFWSEFSFVGEGTGGVERRVCVLFGQKFQVSGAIWVEMLGRQWVHKPQQVWLRKAVGRRPAVCR